MSGPTPADRPAATPGGAADPSMEDILASIRRILSEDEAPAQLAPASTEMPAEPAAPGASVLLLDEAMLVHEETPAATETREPAPEPPPEPIEATEPQVAHPMPASRQPDPFDDFDTPAPAADPFEAASEPPPVAEAPAAPDLPPPTAAPEPSAVESPSIEPSAVEPAAVESAAVEPSAAEPPEMAPPEDPTPPLLAPEVADATVSSVGALMRQLVEERTSQVYRGGPTIEDMVRQEMQPLLTQWVNLNMGPVVGHMLGGVMGPLVRDWLDLNLATMTERMVAVEMRLLLKEWLDLNLPPMVERLVKTELERLMARAVR